MNDLFIKASRKKFRFDSVRQPLSVEQLWDLPLENTASQFSLNDVGMGIIALIDISSKGSLVAPSTVTAKQKELEEKLDIIKFIIKTKQDESAKATEAVAKRAKRNRLLEALANKEEAELSNASKEDIMKELAALDD